LRVLVVDDELLIRWSVAETFSRSGHAVEQASNGADALRAVREAVVPFDAVVLDYRLPDSNDFGLLSNIRTLSPGSRVVLITAHGSPDITRGALERGASAVVAKPFDLNDLQNIVLRACD
jgi:DNA-binding NtrC family response regulator